MEKVTVFKNEKGFYAKGSNTPFGIIDKAFHSSLKEGEEWEMEIVRKITDKRGKEVPILRPVKRIYRFNEARGVFTCGSHTFKPSRISVKEIREGWLGFEIVGEALSPDGESFPFSVSWYTFQDWEGIPEVRNNVENHINEIRKKREEESKKFLAQKKEEEFPKFLELLKQKILESENKALAYIEKLKEWIKVMFFWTGNSKFITQEDKELVYKHEGFIYANIDLDTGEFKNFDEKLASLQEEIKKTEEELIRWKNMPLEEKIKIMEEDLDIKVQIFRFVNNKFKWDTWSFVKHWLSPEE